MINVAGLLRDPDFAQPFTVIRSVGSFANEGEYVRVQSPGVTFFGVIQPAKQQDVARFMPEGARLNNLIVVYCQQEIQRADAIAQESDIIVWRNQQYRVVESRLWRDHGYWQVFAEGLPND